jgi:hypothetical protein
MLQSPNAGTSTTREVPQDAIYTPGGIFNQRSRRVRLGTYFLYLAIAGVIIALLSGIPGIPHKPVIFSVGLWMMGVLGSAAALILGFPLLKGGWGEG